MMKNKFYSKRNINVFNTPIEIGLRALIILNELSGESIDLNRLVIYDYLVTHSSDFNEGMNSLHPPSPHRSGELIIKRKIMQEGINLMYSKELLDIEYTKDGIYYKANQLSSFFIGYLDSTYALNLMKFSKMVIQRFKYYSDKELSLFVKVNIPKWGSEFTKESLVRGDI
ncbi:hypothetical protein MUG87_08810 [Ectobacillus sp. JY-23]|uniref:ABC-three component system middle component 2 n=1 Tax=Ectobacillus sp. JY-23 TaxID=2933872 RepID=UPI001FF672C9|nr:ABC-three component system middle component 2 [Ectobacillus sp. JY-23]UOY94182.1 hypothetical protein MUG87_08810 [Ectobacillus sp. JY-23]